MDQKASDDDGYNLTYERQESTEQLAQRLEQQNSELKLRLSSLTTILKVGLVTIIILVLVVLGCLSVILVNTSGTDEDIDSRVLLNAQTLNLNGSNTCNLRMDGKLNKSLMLTDTDKLHTIHLVGPDSCQVRVLVVGGGGYSSYGGGGSGEVLYDTIQLNPGTVISAKVGEPIQTLHCYHCTNQ